MSKSDDAFKGAPLRIEIKFSRRLETGMWMAEVFALWTIGSTESCEYLGGSKDYDHATRSEAATAITGIAEEWLAKHA